MKRILLYATWPDEPIGYAKVAHVVANWLADQPDTEVVYLGNSRSGRSPSRVKHPALRLVDISTGANDIYGVDRIEGWLTEYKPAIFLVYSDIIVTCRLYNALLGFRAAHPEIRFVSYLDLVYPWERMDLVRHVDRNTDLICVFSPCWRQNLIDMGVCSEKIHVFPHGFASHLFHPMAKADARRCLGIPDNDAYILLNMNRNTYRKAQDILIRAFVTFLIRESFDPRIVLFIHCAPTSSTGYSIPDLLETEAARQGVPLAALQQHILSMTGAEVSDEVINWIYNACDVGINTCMGEGFGLCNMEHGALGKPQIVSHVGALPDIFACGGALLIPPRVWIRAPNTLDEHSGDLGICDADDFAAAMSLYFHDVTRRVEDGAFATQHISSAYAWDRLLTNFGLALARLDTKNQ